MRKAFFICAFMCVLTVSWAAEKFTGVLTYSIEYVDVPSDMQKTVDLLPQKFMLYIGDNAQKSVRKGKSGEQVEIFNFISQTRTSMMDFLGMKVAIIHDMAGFEKGNKDWSAKGSGNSKKICGMSCSLMTDGTNQGYYSTEYEITHPHWPSTPGLPAEMILDAKGLKMKLVLQKVDKKAPKDDEFVIPEEYVATTTEELEQMLGLWSSDGALIDDE